MLLKSKSLVTARVCLTSQTLTWLRPGAPQALISPPALLAGALLGRSTLQQAPDEHQAPSASRGRCCLPVCGVLGCLSLLQFYQQGNQASEVSVNLKPSRSRKPFCPTFLVCRQDPRDLPGGPVAKTSRSQCRGPGFNPTCCSKDQRS